jgi:hypothetical protein
MGFSWEQLEQFYGVPVPLEYNDRIGNWLVISIGAGLMMSVMDLIPQVSRCVDMGNVPKDARFADWLACAERMVGGIIVCGWYSISNPQPMRDAIAALQHPERVLTYIQPTGLGVGQDFATLDELKDAAVQAAGSAMSNMPSLPDTGKGLMTSTAASLNSQTNISGLNADA